MLAALNTKEAHSRQKHDKHNDMPNFKICDLILIKNVDKKSNWDAKHVPDFRVIKLKGTRQIEVSDQTGKLQKVNISDVHKILPADFIVSCIPNKQDFPRKGKYINDPYIMNEVSAIDAFLHEYFLDVRLRHQ